MLDETSDYPDATELRSLKSRLAKEDSRFDLINDFKGDTDWVREITRTPVSQTHYVSLQGGNARTNYLASVTYNDKQGIYKGSFDESLTAKLSINHAMFDDRFKIALNVSNKIVTQGIVPDDLYMQALSRNPTIPVYNADGSYYENSNGANPVGLLKEQNTENKYDQLMMSGRISVEPVKDLTISATGIYMGDFNDYAYSTTQKLIHRRWAARRDRRDSPGATARTRHSEYRPTISRKFGRHTRRQPSDISYNDYIHQSSEMYAYDFPIDGFGAWNIGSANRRSMAPRS